MNRDDFKSGLTDLDLAISAQGLAADQDELGPPEGAEGVQVASVGGQAAGRWAAKLFGKERAKLYNRSSRELVKNKPVKPEPASIGDVNKALDSFGKDKTRVTQPIDAEGGTIPPAIETEDQLTQLVEQVGSVKFPDKRSWAEVQARTDTVSKVMKELRPITEGRQGGTLSDVQLHGVSRIVATAFDDVKTITAKIADGTETPEDIIRLINAKDTYEVMSGYLKGQSSEVGRALNSLKMTGEALKNKDLAAYEALTADEKTGLSKYAKEWGDAITKRMEKGDSVGKAMEFVGSVLKADKTKIAVEFWKNNQLSGIKTHVVNNASVGAHMLYENIAIRPLASGIGAVRTGMRPGADRIAGDELMAPLYSSYAGVRGWMGLFWDNMKSGKSAFNAMDKVEDSGALADAIKGSNVIPQNLKKAADFATSASFKLLSATDEAHRGIAFTSELYGLASRQASKEGKRGEAHVVRMNEILDDPTVEMYDQAMTHAKQMTFTDVEQRGWIGSTSKALRTMIGEIPPLQFVIPYVNTPSNLLRVGMEMSPLAPLSQRLREDIAAGGVKADIAMAKMVGGMGMGLMYWQLYESGLLTGGGPEDYKAQEMLKADGWQPWGIEIGGKSYGMERMDPFTKSAKFTESLASFIGEMDKAKWAATDADKENAFARGMMYMVDAMMEDQWLEQASSFIKVLEGEESFDKYVARTAAGFVPYHALGKSIKDFQQSGRSQLSQDSIESSVLSMFEDQVRGNMPDMPGLDPYFVRPKRNWDGEIHMPGQSSFAAGTSPWGPTSLKHNLLTRELVERGVTPLEPSSILSIKGKDLSLLQLDESGRLYDEYLKIVGGMRKEVLEKTMAKSAYKRAKKKHPDGPNSYMEGELNDAMSKGKVAGQKLFLRHLLDIIDKYPGIETPLNIRFGSDMKAMIKESLREPELSELKGPATGVPARGTFEYPIPEMK